LQALKNFARRSYKPLGDDALEVKLGHYFPDDLSFPRRPKEANSIGSQAKLEALEEEEFARFVSNAVEKHPDLSHFELNLVK